LKPFDSSEYSLYEKMSSLDQAGTSQSLDRDVRALLSSKWRSEEEWKQQLSHFTAPLDPQERQTVAELILASADSQRRVGQAMLATTWEWVGESQAWMAARCGEHKFDSWKHFSQQFDPDGVFQNAVKAYRSSESKKQKAVKACRSSEFKKQKAVKACRSSEFKKQKAVKACRSSEFKKQKALSAIASWPPELRKIASTKAGIRILQGLARLAKNSRNDIKVIKLCLNSTTLARFKEGKGRTRGMIFTLSDIDAAAAMAGQIMEKKILRQPISIKDARAAGLRYSNGLLYPSDVFAMEWDPDEPEDQEMSGIIFDRPLSNSVAEGLNAKEIAGAEGERMQESDEELAEERNKEQNRKCLPTSGGGLL
jgi:hypothetical protein